jgi:FixJ family two-component response regulator
VAHRVPNPQLRAVFKLPKVPLISVIDDDASVRDGVESLVRSLGYTVATFSSAEEYLESGLARDSSCLITDLAMRGMSGADLQERLVAQGSVIPVIIMTASRDEGLRSRVLSAGARGYLRKPFGDQQLIDCLANVLKPADRGTAAVT